MTLDLTADEHLLARRMLADLHARGFRPRDRFNELTAGARVRLTEHRRPWQRRAGTGVVLALADRKPSAWARAWAMTEVEVLVAWDRPAPGPHRLAALEHHLLLHVPRPLTCPDKERSRPS